MFKIFDLLNGSRLTCEYAEQCLTHGVEAILITINNYRGINPLPDLRQSLRELAAYHQTPRDIARCRACDRALRRLPAGASNARSGS